MTRGTLAIIFENGKTSEHVWQSLEFNGDMWYEENGIDGYGYDAVNELRNVEDMESFEHAIVKFNTEHHNYDLNDERIMYKDDIDILNFNKDYFKNWFSDYVYLKNCTVESYGLKEYETNKVTLLKPNEIAVLNFGKVIAVL